MQHFKYENFVDHYKALGLVLGQNIVCHSSLFSFGKCSAEDAVEALISVVGKAATIAAPAYHFEKTPFDILNPNFTGVGKFSQILFKMDGSVRSKCPVHSHVAIGPKAGGLLENNSEYSFGHKSDFDWFLKNDFDLILLGCSFSRGATYLHHIETLMQVPYRKWVSSPKQCLIAGETKIVDFKYFARSDTSFHEDFNKIPAAMKEELKIVQTPFGRSYRVSLKKLTDFVMNRISLDPYFLVKKNEDN